MEEVTGRPGRQMGHSDLCRGMVGMVIAGQLVAILKTQNLMAATGGRGLVVRLHQHIL